MLLPILLLAAAAVGALGKGKDGPSLLVSTTSGRLQGYLDINSTYAQPLKKWYGVRFAADTSGKNRFRP
jgi:hypothetical protein